MPGLNNHFHKLIQFAGQSKGKRNYMINKVKFLSMFFHESGILLTKATN